MKNNVQKIKNIFIKRMVYSTITQILVLGLLIIFVRNYMNHSQLTTMTDDLLIKDQYTIDQIGSYQLLGNRYALDLELHNLGDMRKLDSIKFVQDIKKESRLYYCTILNDKNFQICREGDGNYFGISVVLSGNKILGYILASKKYHPAFSVPVMYDLFLILLTVLGTFIFNFMFLFLSIKKRIESNTKLLLNFISAGKNIDDAFPQIDIEEYKIAAQIFIAEKNEIAVLQRDKMYYEAKKIIAEQVAHDIRSPLSAINTAVSNVKEISEKRRIMIKNASKRINDIANNLLSQYKNDTDIKNTYHNAPELIFVILDSIISEKRYEYDRKPINIELHISEYSYGCFSELDLISFKRVLSNLINNSVEAIGSNGQVTVSMDCNEQYVEITIEDNGCGIPDELISQVTLHGFSYKKPSGAGFGLSYAKQYIDTLNGKVFIDSSVNVGTKVTIKLLRCLSPVWFCQEIFISENSTIVVLDDDPSIHETWGIKLADIQGVKIIDYSDASKITPETILENNANLYLVDYELLGSKNTGLDIISERGLAKNAILVTSCFEDNEVRIRCEGMGIKVIPKSFVPYIPVIACSHGQRSTVVFIDDDENMRMTWSFAAEEAGEIVNTFSSPEEFNKFIGNYDNKTKIYVDSDLADNIKGEFYAKELHEKGFTELYLATGHSALKFKDIYWIKSVVNKEPPFIV